MALSWQRTGKMLRGSRFVIRIPLVQAHLRTDELEDVEALITPHAVLVKPRKDGLEEVFEEEG